MQDLVTLYDRHESAQVRAQRQQRLTAQYKLPLITLNTYMPKHMVHSTYAKKLFNVAMDAVQTELKQNGFQVIKKQTFNQKTGDEVLYVVQGFSSSELKRTMMLLEKNHPLGSLINVDVMNPEGKTISRQACDIEPRKCLVCDNAASYCVAIHNHSGIQMEEKVILMIDNYEDMLQEAVA